MRRLILGAALLFSWKAMAGSVSGTLPEDWLGQRTMAGDAHFCQMRAMAQAKRPN